MNRFEAALTRYLPAGARLGELLCGLIMTLTFTLSAGALVGDTDGATRSLLYATLGCNVAWGIIDAWFYLLGVIFDRSRLVRIGVAIEHDEDTAAVARVASELDSMLSAIASDDRRTDFYRHIVGKVRGSARSKVRITGADVRAALLIFALVVVATLPAALPFALIDDPTIALRTSNALLIGFLFIAGYHWAKYTSLNPWLLGGALTAFGVALVFVAIVLGG